MVIDTSAIIAIAFDEPGASAFETCIADDPVRLISAATVFEASMVLESRLGEQGGSENWISGCIGSTPKSYPSLPTIPIRLAAPGAAMAKAAIQPD
jgi:hypothetical protein